MKNQPSVIGDDPDLIMRQHAQRRRTKLILELAELFDRLQTTYEDMLRTKWEIGVKLRRAMAEEAYGDKVAFVIEIARALGRSRSSVYECLRLAEKWHDFDALLWSVRAHIDEQLSGVSNMMEKSELEAKTRTWRYIARNVLTEKKRGYRRRVSFECALAGVPGHVCQGEARQVTVCAEALDALKRLPALTPAQARPQ